MDASPRSPEDAGGDRFSIMSDERKGPGKGRRSDIPWAEVQVAYEQGHPVAAIARHFSITRNSIMRHRDAEKWQVKEQAKEQLHRAAQNKVIDIATRRAIENLGGEKAIEEQAEAIANELQAQRPLFAKAAKLLNNTFDRALKLGEVDKDGKPVIGQIILGVTQGETTAVTDLLNALSKFVRDTRLANGLRDGTPTVSGEDDDEKRVDQAVLVVRPPAQSA